MTRASVALLLATQAVSPVGVIQEYARAEACTANPNVRLSAGRDAALPGERVLLVEYPAPSADPAARDIRCASDLKDWTVGSAIAFQVKPDQSMRMSVSFLDRNRVAYTAWRDLQGGEWQMVRIPFEEIQPNPFFQPPGAKKGVPIDVREVNAILFAPQDQTSGRLAIGRFIVSR